MQHLVKIALGHLMLVSSLAARDQTAVSDKPVTISSTALEITFNGNGGPEQALARPGDEPVKFRTDLPVISVMTRDAQGKVKRGCLP
jgi:hypothetical protein